MSKESVEQEIHQACEDAGCAELAQEFIDAERSLGWVRNWIKQNPGPKPTVADVRASLKNAERRPKGLEPDAIYRRFNNPPKRAATR